MGIVVFLQKGIAFPPMLGIGLSRATGGQRTTVMVSLQKGIAPSGMDGCHHAPYAIGSVNFDLYPQDGEPRVFFRKEQPLLLYWGSVVASHRWVTNYGYGFLERNSLYPYVGDRLLRATGGSLTTGMVFLQKGIAPSGMDRLERYMTARLYKALFLFRRFKNKYTFLQLSVSHEIVCKPSA